MLLQTTIREHGIPFALKLEVPNETTNDMPILHPTVMNKAILFLASPASKGITGEKIIGKDIDEWLNNKNIKFGD